MVKRSRFVVNELLEVASDTSFTEHGVMFIKYCSILLQALTIEADEDLLFAIYDLTKIKGISWEDGGEE